MSVKKTVFAGNTNSQYDPALIATEVHDFFGQSIRTLDTRSVITSYFTHLRADYDGSNNPTNVKYYRGTAAYKTLITCTSAASLNNKYFTLHSAPDNQLYVVWYNVDGLGIAPVISGAKYIAISGLLSSDSAEVVSAATKITIESLFSDKFTVPARNGAVIEVATNGMGVINDSFDVNTGFSIMGTQGTQELISEITISYVGGHPLYEGQVLTGYYYDIYSGKFLRSAAVDIQNLSVSVDLNAFDVDPDSVLTVGSEDGTESGVKHALKVGADLNLRVKDEAANTTLTAIGTALAGSLLTAGTEDGTISGPVFVTVNNSKQQILAAHDREQNITYADFGTKNQRITQVDYTSSTFPGITARKTLTYTQVGNFYRRDSINWEII